MATSKRVEWIMPVYSAAAVSTLRVRVPANMGWFLFRLAGARRSCQRIRDCFLDPSWDHKPESLLSFHPRPWIRAVVRVGAPPRLLVLRPSPARLVLIGGRGFPRRPPP